MNNIITLAEYTLITGLSLDEAKFNFWQKIAINLLQDAFGVKSLSTHSVVNEEHKISSGEYIRPLGFPVDVSSVDLYLFVNGTTKISGYTFLQDDYDVKKLWILDDGGRQSFLPYDRLFLKYDAGYITTGTIKVEDNDLDTETLTYAGTTYTFTTGTPTSSQIAVGLTATATASNIATKLSLTSSGDTVSGVGLTATTSDDDKLIITNANVPEDIKACVAYLISGGSMDTVKSGEVASYSIGGKTVNFRSDGERGFVKATVSKYGKDFMNSLILS